MRARLDWNGLCKRRSARCRPIPASTRWPTLSIWPAPVGGRTADSDVDVVQLDRRWEAPPAGPTRWVAERQTGGEARREAWHGGAKRIFLFIVGFHKSKGRKRKETCVCL